MEGVGKPWNAAHSSAALGTCYGGCLYGAWVSPQHASLSMLVQFPGLEVPFMFAQSQRVRMDVVSALAREVTNGTFTHVTNSGHFIQREDPDLVVWAIRRVVDASLR